MIVTAVDTTGIQEYIFRSNRLRENIGASYLVAAATDEWAREAACEAGHDQELYAGGGNFVCRFSGPNDGWESARAFERILSRRALCEAPGLQLVFGHHEKPQEESLCAAVQAAFEVLAQKKQCRALPSPLLGLSITRACASTGLPASTTRQLAAGEGPRPVSAEIAAKHDHAHLANRKLNEVFKKTRGLEGYEFPTQLDHLGRSFGEHSHLAVVHADGNDMGRRIEKLRSDDDEQYEKNIRNFSEKVKEAGEAAMRDVLETLLGALQEYSPAGDQLGLKDNQGEVRSLMQLKQHSGMSVYLPFRPLVFGGDDVTFVCDGRLGISLALRFLRAFEQRTKDAPELGGKISACAGIAVVPVHHPFAVSYVLAEALTASAKAYRNELKDFDESFEGACLDWHLAETGVLETLARTRTRQYSVPNQGSLTLRPLTMDKNPLSEERAWPVVRSGLLGFQGSWSCRRNKVKELREVLREGVAEVEAWLRQSGVAGQEFSRLPTVLPGRPDMAKKGWGSARCLYFDAVEMEDQTFLLDADTASTASGVTSALAIVPASDEARESTLQS